MTYYYSVLSDSGLIGKIDSYLSFLRRQESRRESLIEKEMERFIWRAIIKFRGVNRLACPPSANLPLRYKEG
jgi:hypothetical protein